VEEECGEERIDLMSIVRKALAVIGIVVLMILLQWIGTSPFPSGRPGTLYSEIAHAVGKS